MLSIIIPTYNEIENLKEFIEALNGLSINLEHEIIIVDDHSSDGTGEVGDLLKEKHSNLSVIHRAGKMGSASAIAEGVKSARGELIATLNADFQHPVEFLPVMLKRIDECDIVIASRYIREGSVEGWNKRRLIMSTTGTFLSYLFIPRIRPIRDPLSGFFVFKKSVVKDVRMNPPGFKYLLEMLSRGAYDKVIEVPYVFKKRLKGRSKISFKDGVVYLCHLFYLSLKS